MEFKTGAPYSAVCGVDGKPNALALAKGKGKGKGEELFQNGPFGFTWERVSDEEARKKLKARAGFAPGELPGWRYTLMCSVGKDDFMAVWLNLA